MFSDKTKEAARAEAISRIFGHLYLSQPVESTGRSVSNPQERPRPSRSVFKPDSSIHGTSTFTSTSQYASSRDGSNSFSPPVNNLSSPPTINSPANLSPYPQSKNTPESKLASCMDSHQGYNAPSPLTLPLPNVGHNHESTNVLPYRGDEARNIPQNHRSQVFGPAPGSSYEAHAAYWTNARNHAANKMRSSALSGTQSDQQTRASSSMVNYSLNDYPRQVSGFKPLSYDATIAQQVHLAGVGLEICRYQGTIGRRFLEGRIPTGKRNCQLWISGIPSTASVVEIFRTFTEGAILQWSMKSPKGRWIDCAVTVTFMEADAAAAYMKKSEEQGIRIGGYAVSVAWSANHNNGARSIELRQSRVLKITGESSLLEGAEEIVAFLRSEVFFVLVDKYEYDDGNTKSIFLEFSSVIGQSRPAKVLLEREYRIKGLRHTLEYALDPCHPSTPYGYAAGAQSA